MSSKPEESFQGQVLNLAKLCGWKVVHFRPARMLQGGKVVWRTPVQGDKGFPDLVLARNGYRIFAELKIETGNLSDEQQEWLRELGPTDERTLVTVWRPSDWDAIEKILTKQTRRRT